MVNNMEKMKSFSLDIPVLKETIAKLESSIQNIEKIGNDVECNANKLISESWEGEATKSFLEHNQNWKKGYDEMVNQLLDFKGSLEKVVLTGAEEINELALELPVPLGGSRGTGYRNIISMEQEGIEVLKTNCKTLVYDDYECQHEIMEKIEALSSRLNYPFSIGAAASQNKRIIEENQEKLQWHRGKLQNYEDRVLQFENEVVEAMSKYAVVCGNKLSQENFREFLQYQKDDSWKALLLKNVEGLSDIEKLVLKAEYESGVTYRIKQYINKQLGIEDLTFQELNAMQAEERGKKVSTIFTGISQILNACQMVGLPIGLTVGKDLGYIMAPISSLESSKAVDIRETLKNAFNIFKTMPNSPIFAVDNAMNVFNNSIDGIAALIQGKEVTWTNKGMLYSLDQAFDKTENYEDKFAEGNISGCYLNFEGETLGLPQSILLNAYNNYDSLTTGEGLQSWQRKMDYTDCEKEYFERRGERPFSERLSEENKYLGFGYVLLMNILTDPLSYAGGVMAAAKGTSKLGTVRYMDDLIKGETIYTKTFEAEKLAKASNGVDDIVQKGVKYESVDEIAKGGTVSIEGGIETISKADRIRIKSWEYTPNDELYLKYKDVYDNPLYYDQATGKMHWPIADGFKGGSKVDKIIDEGTIFKRYGENSGEFLGNATDSFEARALAPHSEVAEVHYYQLTEDYKVTAGEAAPWFGSDGGAEQFVKYKPDGSKYTIKELEDAGILEDVTDLVKKGDIKID